MTGSAGSMTGLAAPALQGAGWMMLTMLSFVTMSVAGRELAANLSAFEVVTLRAAVGTLILLPIVWRAGFAVLATARPLFHGARNAVHFVGQVSWFYALGVLPLAEVTAIEYTMALWSVVLAAMFLGERIDARRWAAIAVGFAGVLIILRPGMAAVSPAALIMLGGAAFYGASITMVKSLTRTDRALAIVFYMNLMQFAFGLGPALADWTMPGWGDVPWILLAGVCGLTAHYCFSRALALLDVSVAAPIDYLRLPTAALVGYLVYAELVDIWVGVGSALVFAANYYNVWREARGRK